MMDSEQEFKVWAGYYLAILIADEKAKKEPPK